MSISEGETLPEATLLRIGENGPEPVALADRIKGRKVVLFGLPGAFTNTCSTAHVPSFIRQMPALTEKGIDAVICVSVNDPFVMAAWSDATGAGEAGVEMLADPTCALIEALGMRFDAPAAGFVARSVRFSLMAEDGVVRVLHTEPGPGVCEATAGEAMVASL